MNHVGCNREIDQKGKCIHDGGNHGGGHDGGVEADFICQKRQTAAHQFGKNNDKHEGEADGKRNRHIDAIEEHQFDKVGGRECDATEGRHSHFLPDGFENIGEDDFVKGKTTNDRYTGLRTCISAGVHQHRYIGGQNDIGCQCCLEFGDNGAGKGGANH